MSFFRACRVVVSEQGVRSGDLRDQRVRWGRRASAGELRTQHGQRPRPLAEREPDGGQVHRRLLGQRLLQAQSLGGLSGLAGQVALLELEELRSDEHLVLGVDDGQSGECAEPGQRFVGPAEPPQRDGGQ